MEDGREHESAPFRLWDMVQSHLVAIKEQDTKTQDSLTEMCVMQMVGNHKRIVRLIDVFVSESSTFLVMEYLPGGDLMS